MNNKSLAVLIPARYNSKRLYKKPLIKIGKQNLINRTFDNITNCFDKNDIYVITDHKNVVDSLSKKTNNLILIKKNFLNGTERCSFALKKIKKKYDYYLIVSCDNPFLNKKLFNFLKFKLKNIDKKIDAFTIHTDISEFKARNKNIAKIIVNHLNDVIYISRSLIPFIFKKHKSRLKYHSHHGLVLFKRKVLENYKNLKLEENQIIEDNEWLKLIFNKIIFKSFFYKNIEPEINTKHDLKKYFPLYFKK